MPTTATVYKTGNGLLCSRAPFELWRLLDFFGYFWALLFSLPDVVKDKRVKSESLQQLLLLHPKRQNTNQTHTPCTPISFSSYCLLERIGQSTNYRKAVVLEVIAGTKGNFFLNGFLNSILGGTEIKYSKCLVCQLDV